MRQQTGFSVLAGVTQMESLLTDAVEDLFGSVDLDTDSTALIVLHFESLNVRALMKTWEWEHPHQQHCSRDWANMRAGRHLELGGRYSSRGHVFTPSHTAGSQTVMGSYWIQPLDVAVVWKDGSLRVDVQTDSQKDRLTDWLTDRPVVSLRQRQQLFM